MSLAVHLLGRPHVERDGEPLGPLRRLAIHVRDLDPVEVAAPDGDRVSLRIPAGSEDGKLLRLRGRGAPKLKPETGRGDLLARVRVAVPKKLSKQEREAVEQLRRVSHENPRERAFSR